MSQEQYKQFAEEQSQGVPMGIPVGNIMQNGQPLHPGIQQPQMCPQSHPQFTQQVHMPPPPPVQPNNVTDLNAQPNIMKGYPINTVCPCCKATVRTVVNVEPGNSTYVWSAVLCVCCFPWPCYCAPFLMDSCQDKAHYCPNCGFNILRKHQGCFEFCQ